MGEPEILKIQSYTTTATATPTTSNNNNKSNYPQIKSLT